MSRKCSLFLAIILLLFSRTGLSADFYAMGCKPAETPKQAVSKPAEETSPSAAKQPSLPGGASDQKIIGNKGNGSKSGNFEQIAAFKTKKNAEKLMKKLSKEGHKTEIRKAITKEKGMVYRVFAKKDKGVNHEKAALKKPSVPGKPHEEERLTFGMREQSRDHVSSGAPKQKTTQEKSGIAERPADSGTFPEKPGTSSQEVLLLDERKDTPPGKPGEEKPLEITGLSGERTDQRKDIPSTREQKHTTVAEKLPVEEKPLGTVRKRATEDVFGRRGGFVHPFLSVTEYYTDNVFYAAENKKSDFITILSPGIWLTIPHVYEKMLEIETSNISPGGLTLSRYKPESFRRYQVYMFYNADIEQFSKYSSENTVSHRAEGLFQYNLKGGLSLELADQYSVSHDIRGTGISSRLDKYRNNLANVIATYELSERFKLRVDYNNFLVNYTASRNDFRDRDDNALSGYLFYRLQPKTTLFIEYEYLDVQYQEDVLSDSKEHHYFCGVQWDITAKSKGSVKAGYGVKDFTRGSIKNSDNFILEAQIDHKFTPKTSLIIRASRRTNETNISTADFILSDTVEVEYLQKVTGKITGDIKLAYSHDKYRGDVLLNGEQEELEDNYFLGAFALQYKFKEWLEMDLGYIYDRRDSSFSDFDYTNNIGFIKVTGSL